MGKNYIEENTITVFADATLYSKEAIFKCLYWYGGQCRTAVELLAGSTYQISLTPLTSASESVHLIKLLAQFERDLIDFNLRDMVSRETRNVRDLLIAKAFSNGEFDEDPAGELSDPVGFEVTRIAYE